MNGEFNRKLLQERALNPILTRGDFLQKGSVYYAIKLFKYRSAGVREYWIVDPLKQRNTVYSFEHDTMEEYSFEEEIPVGIYEGFCVKLR